MENRAGMRNASVYNCCVDLHEHRKFARTAARMKKRYRLVISIAVAVMAISTAVLAQQEDVEELSQRATEGEAIDEITVYGEQSMSSLRYQIYRAEEDFFDLFSELNDDDEFDEKWESIIKRLEDNYQNLEAVKTVSDPYAGLNGVSGELSVLWSAGCVVTYASAIAHSLDTMMSPFLKGERDGFVDIA